MPEVARKYKEYDLRFEPNRWGNKLYEKYGGDNIIAYDESGKEVGRLFYMQNTPESDLGISIGVNPEHQRKGIATAMVRMAQDITGRGIAAQDANVEGRPFLESLEREEYTPKPPVVEEVPEVTEGIVIPQLISDPSGTVDEAQPTAEFFPNIKPTTKLPKGTILRVTTLQEGKRRSFWAIVEVRGGKLNLYAPVNKKSEPIGKQKGEDFVQTKELISHSLIVKEELARENVLLGELQIVKLKPKPPVVEEVIPERLTPLPNETKAEFVERNLKGIGRQRAGNRSILKTMYDRARRLESEAKPPVVEEVRVEIPVTLQPIIEEARRYGSIEEFVNANPQLNNEMLYSQIRDFAMRNRGKSPQEIQGNLIKEFGEDPTIILYRGISPTLRLTPRDQAFLGTGKVGKFWSPNPAHSALFVRGKGSLYAVEVKASDLLKRDLAEIAQGEIRLGSELQESAIEIAVAKPPVVEEGNPDTGTSIIDLRGDYDEIAHVKGGILYRKGSIIQVWWDKWGKETWRGPSEKEARENFNAMKERWSSSEFGNPKEPWQMTQKEYVRPPYTSPAMHKFGVGKALREGKPVPAEVLAEYPDLKPPVVEAGKPEASLKAEIEAVSKKYLSDMKGLGPHRSYHERQALTDKYTAKIEALKQQPQTMKEGNPPPIMARPPRTDQIGSTAKPTPEIVIDIGGFEKTLSPANRAKAIEQMNMKKMIAGKSQSRKEYIEDAVVTGAVVGIKEGKPALVFPDGRYIRQSEITKTALDYADYLKSTPTPPPQARGPGNPDPQQIYDAALEAFREASRKFMKIREAYRAREIGDKAFLEGRAVFDRAQEVTDAAEQALRKAEKGNPSRVHFDRASESDNYKIPKTLVTSLGVELELPIARAVVAFGIYEKSKSGGANPMITNVDTALKDIADWYVDTKRGITEPELDSILLKHCGSEAEVQKFVEFLETEPGQLRFKTLLRERKGG